MDTVAQLYQLATRQGGVVTRTQAIGLGLSERQIDRRVAVGRWRRCFPGGYQLFDPIDPMAKVRAAVAILPNAVASHYSAALLHRFERVPDGPPSVMVHTQTTHSFPGVRVHRAHDVLEHHRERIDGTATTSASRTVVDLSGVLTMTALGIVVDDAVSTGATDIASIQGVLEEVARRGKRGVRKLRLLLDERSLDDRSGSILERRGNRVLSEAGLAGFVTEYSIPWSPTQRFDLAFVDERVAVEWDSRRWHSIQEAFESDRRRDRMALLNGWRLLRFSWSDVHDRPYTVVATVAQLLGR